jgi:hypothetical protein
VSPTVFREGPYRFYFFSREEPRKHVHVICPDGEAKFWLEPHVELAVANRISPQSLRTVEAIVENRKQEIIDAWYRHFSD